MNILSFACFITSLLTFALGIYIAVSSQRSRSNTLWLVFTFFIAVWSFGFGMMGLSRDPGTALLWIKVQNGAAVFIPVAFLHFILTYLGTLTRPKQKVIAAGYLVGLALLAATFAGWIFDVQFAPFGLYYTTPGRVTFLYLLHVLVFYTFLIWAFSEMIAKYRTTLLLEERQRIKYLFLASVIGFAGGTTAFLPEFGLRVYPYGIYLIPLYVTFLSIAIVRYRFMDVEVALQRGQVYAFNLLIALVPFYFIISVFLLKQEHLSLNVFGVVSIFLSFLSFFFGLFVYLQNRESHVNRSWMTFSMFLAIWSFGFGMSVFSLQREAALFWLRLDQVGAIFIPAAYLQFVLRFLEGILDYRRKHWLVGGAYGLGVYLLAANLFTDQFVDIRPFLSFAYYPKAQPLYYPYLLLFVACIGYAHYALIRALKGSVGLRRSQLLYSILASVIGYGGGSTVFLPAFDIPIYPYGYYFLPLYIVIMSYAIAKYRLLDVDLLARKGLAYGSLFLLILGPPLPIVLLAQQAYFGTVSLPFTLLLFALVVVTTLILYQVRPGVESVIDRIFFRERYSAYKILSDFTKAMVSILDLKELLAKIVETLVNTIRAKKVCIFLLDGDRKVYVPVAFSGVAEESLKPVPLWDDLSVHLRRRQEILIREELERRIPEAEAMALFQRMDAMDSEVCLPLATKGQLIGFCSLGQKASMRMYSHEDLELLSNLAREAAIAIENARLYEQERKGAARLSAVLATTAAINSEVSREAVLQVVIEQAVQVLGADRGTLYALDEATQELKPVAWVNLSQAIKEFVLRVGELATGKAVLERRPIAIPDVEAGAQEDVNLEVARREGIRALLTLPLIVKDKVVGAMSVYHATPHPFSEQEIATLTLFAHQAAIALENARLFRELWKAYEDLQRTQAALVEAERHEALTALAGAAAHELNQPLATITIYTDLLLRGLDQGDPRYQKLRAIAQEADRIAEIVKKISRITRYETKPYMGGQRIVDLEHSAESRSPEGSPS